VQADFETVVSLRSAVRVPRIEPGAPLVLALHGWGMNERSFERWLGPGMDRGTASWWIPRGVLPLEVKSRKIGYAWYVFDGEQDALRASMDEACAYVWSLAEVARRALRPPAVVLLGFSQGAYLGSYAALQRPDLFDGFVCCCGRPKAEFVRDLDAARGVRVLVQTGARDESVAPELVETGVAPLRAAGLDVDARSYDAAHRLTPEMALDAAAFAARVAGAKAT
jgi:predicted esterase